MRTGCSVHTSMASRFRFAFFIPLNLRPAIPRGIFYQDHTGRPIGPARNGFHNLWTGSMTTIGSTVATMLGTTIGWAGALQEGSCNHRSDDHAGQGAASMASGGVGTGGVATGGVGGVPQSTSAGVAVPRDNRHCCDCLRQQLAHPLLLSSNSGVGRLPLDLATRIKSPE